MSRYRNFRPNDTPPVVKALVIINAVVWILQLIFDQTYGLTDKLGLYPLYAGFKPYQLITHMFSHASFMHILFNMFALWTFGRMLENRWGGKRFLNFYMACGLGAGIIHLLVQYYTQTYSMAIGASGAIMGVLAAFAYLFPNTELYLLFIPIPIKAKWAVAAMVAYDLFGGTVGMSGDNIAHFAHLGGALTGFIIVLFWNKKNRKQFY
jgi:membrane associated rhomboid family serine protease